LSIEELGRPSLAETLKVLRMLRDTFGVRMNYDQIQLNGYKKIVQTGWRIVDVGAHDGRHTAEFLRLVGPTGYVHAFEPIPEKFIAIQALEAAHINLKTHNIALSDVIGEAEFFVVKGALEESGLRQRIYNNQEIANPIAITTSVKTLDAMADTIGKVDLLKIDVEGAELNVLNGANELIKKSRPIIYTEYGCGAYSSYGRNAEDLFLFFSDLKYVALDLFGNVIDSLSCWKSVCDYVYWDYIFVPNEKIDPSQNFWSIPTKLPGTLG